MRVAVIGATGLVGPRLAPLLREHAQAIAALIGSTQTGRFIHENRDIRRLARS